MKRYYYEGTVAFVASLVAFFVVVLLAVFVMSWVYYVDYGHWAS